jgi:hypothetical protein
MSDWSLAHQVPYSQRPYLFYAAFADQEVINQLEETHVIHPMLEIASMPASHFRSGRAWEKLRQERPELAGRVAESPLAVALHGQVLGHQSLEYLRDTLTVMTALLGHGACAVYDPLTHTWYGPGDWPGHDKFRALDHVVIRENETRVGTRGLRKFGRPDLEIELAGQDPAKVRGALEQAVLHLVGGGVLAPHEPFEREGWRMLPGDIEGGPDAAEHHNFHQALTLNP